MLTEQCSAERDSGPGTEVDQGAVRHADSKADLAKDEGDADPGKPDRTSLATAGADVPV